MKETFPLSAASKTLVEVLEFRPDLDTQSRPLEPRLSITGSGNSYSGGRVISVGWTVDHVKEACPDNTFMPGELIERRKAEGRSAALHAARIRLAGKLGGQAPETLQQARLAAGLSQLDLALYLGSTQPSVARLEAGRDKNPGLQTLRGICKALALDMNTVEKFFF